MYANFIISMTIACFHDNCLLLTPKQKNKRKGIATMLTPKQKKLKERDSYNANSKGKEKNARENYEKNKEQRKSTMQKYYREKRSRLLFNKLVAYYNTSGLSKRAARLVIRARKYIHEREVIVIGSCSYSLHEPKQHTRELCTKIIFPKSLRKSLSVFLKPPAQRYYQGQS